MSIQITKQDWETLAEIAKGNPDGTAYMSVAKMADDRELFLVMGYNEENKLSSKLAFNTDDLQCDYAWDWEMPTNNNGEVWDTETAVDATNIGWYNDQTAKITRAYNQGELK